MANEITVNSSLKIAKGNIAIAFNDGRFLANMSGDNFAQGVQVLTTTEEAISIGDNASVGVARVKNLSSLYTIQIGVKPAGTFYPMLELKPGEVYLIRLGTSALYGKAETHTASLEYLIAEE